MKMIQNRDPGDEAVHNDARPHEHGDGPWGLSDGDGESVPMGGKCPLDGGTLWTMPPVTTHVVCENCYRIYPLDRGVGKDTTS